MRQSNQNKRMRNRNRKGPNPLTKTFESNGPDGKIRGTALSIAEKYIQASRDATAAGDRIKAENLLQHAEHYNRIVAAAQAQLQPPQQREHETRNEEEDEETVPAFVPPRSVADPDSPQPVVDHSSQVANGVANGKIPNGVKVGPEGSGDEIRTDAASRGPASEEASDEQDAPSPKRRPRGRPRTPRRAPLQPSAIAAEVATRDSDPAPAEPPASDGGENSQS